MKQKSFLNMFLVRFLKTFCILVLLGVAGYISYRFSIAYYIAVDGYQKTSDSKDATAVMEATTDAIAKNLIYSVDESSGEISHIILEIVDTNQLTVDFITIPANTRVVLDKDFLQNLYKVNPSIPQIITLSQLCQYFDQNTVYEYGSLILEYALEEDLSFYTAIPASVYNEMFADDEDKIAQMKEAYLNKLLDIKDQNELFDYLAEYYSNIQSNLSLDKRSTYGSIYLQIEKKQIHYEKLEGTFHNDGFEIDKEAAKEQLTANVGAN